MNCIYCGDTGFTKDGSICEHCRTATEQTSGNRLPKFEDSSLNQSDLSTEAINFLKSYNPNTNYILKGPNNSAKQLLLYEVMDKLRVAGKAKTIPIMSILDLQAVIKGIVYQKDIYAMGREIPIADFPTADFLALRITGNLNQFETEDILRLATYREQHNKNLILTTRYDVPAKLKEDFTIIEV